MAHTHRAVLGTHQEIGIGVDVVHLQVELCLSLVVVHQGLQVGHQFVVHHVAVHGDGESFNTVLLHGLQILDATYLELIVVAIGKSGGATCGDVDGAALHEDASPLAPLLAEECQLARAFEILHGDEATSISPR